MKTYEYDATEVKPMTFSPVPEGKYYLTIENVDERTTKNGDPMFNIEFSFQDPAYANRKVWNNVTLLPPGKPGAGMAIHFLKCIDQPFEGKIVVNPANWLGKTLIAKVGIEQDFRGNDRNCVVAVEHSDPIKDLPATPGAEVPF